jgi:nicotinamidase-related amidase
MRCLLQTMGIFMHSVSVPEFAVARGRMMFPQTRIDPRTTAVIAIDFQRFFIDAGQPMGNVHAYDILENANRINEFVRNAGGLVILTQHSVAAPDEPEAGDALTSEAALLPGSTSYQLHPELVRSSSDVCLVKYRSSALHPKANAGLDTVLEQAGIKTVIVTGIASNGCCDCLARDAFQHGFDVIFASDATAAMTDEEHNAALLNLTLYYARVRSTDEIVGALMPGSSHLI